MTTLSSSNQLKILTRVNTDDFLTSFGLENLRRGRAALEALCWLPARRFAQQMVRYDLEVASEGLRAASTRTLQGYVSRVEVSGQEHIPSEGPLLVLSNHPGMSDTLVHFTSLPRADLKIIAGERPFLQALTNVSRYLFYVSEEAGQRMSVVRNAVGHLRRGGAVLTFPAGQIEPDPASMPGAVASLANWSESVAIFARTVPETMIVTAIVSGVVWPAAFNHPLTRLRRKKFDQERLGAALQVFIQTLLPFYRPVTTRIAFSPAFRAGELVDNRDPAAILGAITSQARRLIEDIQPQPSS